MKKEIVTALKAELKRLSKELVSTEKGLTREMVVIEKTLEKLSGPAKRKKRKYTKKAAASTPAAVVAPRTKPTATAAAAKKSKPPKLDEKLDRKIDRLAAETAQRKVLQEKRDRAQRLKEETKQKGGASGMPV